jgi:iron complex transport system substrate-binding protein
VRRAALVLLLVGSCGRADDAPPPPRVFRDVRGKDVSIPWPPRRVVSILPSATELLYRIGAGDRVAGVTTYCLYPPEAASKPKVGSIVVDGEALAAIRPDVIFTCERMTRQSTAELEGRGYAVFSIDPSTFEEIAAALRLLGEICGRAEAGAKAADELLARVRAAEAKVPPGPGPTVYFEHSAEPLGTSGPESCAGEAVRRAGGRLVFEGGWRMIDWESVLDRDPEVILVSHGRREGLERRPGWAGLRAVKSGRVHLVEKNGFLFHTPRLVDGLEEAVRVLHAKTP